MKKSDRRCFLIQLISNKNVINILRRALNAIDYRLVEHGERVAYVLYKILQEEGTFSQEEMIEMCMVAFLHDIGAYKTEEIDSLTDKKDLLKFEIKKTQNHSIYGYLFIKNFSPFPQYAEAVLYHHTSYEHLNKIDITYKDLAMKIFLADRLCLFLALGLSGIDEQLFFEMRDKVFSAKYIDLIIELEKKEHISQVLSDGNYMAEITGLFNKAEYGFDQLVSFLRMLIYSIDFRSEHTVMHTITTVGISVAIARLLGIEEDELRKIYLGALLHDIGKISTSLLLLEKAGKLTDFEFSMMKDHVVASEYILSGYIDDEILKIAVRHHEKLNGTGYPHRLKAEELTTSQRILAVADISSALIGKRSYKEPFSEEKTKTILNSMAERNEICPQITALVLEHFSDIVENAFENIKDALDQYKNMNASYIKLLDQMKIV